MKRTDKINLESLNVAAKSKMQMGEKFKGNLANKSGKMQVDENVVSYQPKMSKQHYRSL